jgi:hypothetical protein
MFLRNVCWLLTDYKVLYRRRRGPFVTSGVTPSNPVYKSISSSRMWRCVVCHFVTVISGELAASFLNMEVADFSETFEQSARIYVVTSKQTVPPNLTNLKINTKLAWNIATVLCNACWRPRYITCVGEKSKKYCFEANARKQEET